MAILQSEIQATKYLNEVNRLGDAGFTPWTLSFSYGRALQTSVLSAWAGARENAPRAGKVAAALAQANSQAQLGKFDGDHPSTLNDTTLYEGFRGHRSGEDPVGA